MEGSGRAAARSVATIVALGGVALLAGCGGGGGESAANAEPSAKVTVVMADGAYDPASVRILAGSRVTFVNRSNVANTAETDGVGFFEFDRDKLDSQNLFDLHTLQPGEAESVEFDTPGTYRYHSSFDSTMQGAIEVVGRPK